MPMSLYVHRHAQRPPIAGEASPVSKSVETVGDESRCVKNTRPDRDWTRRPYLRIYSTQEHACVRSWCRDHLRRPSARSLAMILFIITYLPSPPNVPNRFRTPRYHVKTTGSIPFSPDEEPPQRRAAGIAYRDAVNMARHVSCQYRQSRSK